MGELVDLWRQNAHGCGAAILGVIIADWVIGAVSEVFLYYKAAEELWWSVVGCTPPTRRHKTTGFSPGREGTVDL